MFFELELHADREKLSQKERNSRFNEPLVHRRNTEKVQSTEKKKLPRGGPRNAHRRDFGPRGQ